MAKRNARRTRKVGLPAGSLVFTGEERGAQTAIRIIDYDADGFAEQTVTSVDACIPYRTKPSITWIDLDGVHDVQVVEKLGDCFGVHRLVLEDVMTPDQRPKAEDHGEYLYVVLKMLTNGKNDVITTEQISIIVGENFVLSFQEGVEGDAFNLIRDRLRTAKGRIRKMGADYLAYSLIDAVVDDYFIALERLGDKIESLEAALIDSPSQETVRRIYSLKRDMIFLHNAVWPLREAVGSLGKHETELIRDATVPYLRDVYDHVIHVIDSVDIYREMLSGMLDMYLSSVSYRLNEVMKILTVIATIFMPLTFLAGVYGMNFKHMPELQWKYGYPLAWLVMIAIAVGMIFFFRRKKWME